MKYKIALVLIFSSIIDVFGSDKKVKGLSFTFCCLPNELMSPYSNSNKSDNIKKAFDKEKTQWVNKISYKIFFDDGSIEADEMSIVPKALIERTDTIKDILNNTLDIFSQESAESVEKEIDEDMKKREEAWKDDYIEKNKGAWQEEYIKTNKESSKQEKNAEFNNKKNNEKKSLIKKLKDPGLFLLGTGLGVVVDRYLLKKIKVR